jgi:glutathione S-transferase
MMCSYAGVEFTNTMYDSGEAWGKDKAALKERNPLMNLPYLKEVFTDGSDAVTTQSNACLVYLDARLGLEPAEPNLKMRNIQVRLPAPLAPACGRGATPPRLLDSNNHATIRPPLYSAPVTLTSYSVLR